MTKKKKNASTLTTDIIEYLNDLAAGAWGLGLIWKLVIDSKVYSILSITCGCVIDFYVQLVYLREN